MMKILEDRPFGGFFEERLQSENTFEMANRIQWHSKLTEFVPHPHNSALVPVSNREPNTGNFTR